MVKEEKYVPYTLNEKFELKERGWGAEARAKSQFLFQVRNAGNFIRFENHKKDKVTN